MRGTYAGSASLSSLELPPLPPLGGVAWLRWAAVCCEKRSRAACAAPTAAVMPPSSPARALAVAASTETPTLFHRKLFVLIFSSSAARAQLKEVGARAAGRS